MNKFIVLCALVSLLFVGCAGPDLEPNGPIPGTVGPVERIAYEGGEQ